MSNSLSLWAYMRGLSDLEARGVRFGLRCIFWLAILYHAILSGHGGAERAVVRDAADAARRQIAGGVDTYCRRGPASCLSDAARLGRLLETGVDVPAASAAPAGSRHRRRGAVASATP